MVKRYSSILIISDTHFPYGHPDTIDFLRALKEKHKPDKVIHIGDEIDFHAISFHPSDPDLLSPGDELASAIRKLKPLYKLFPDVSVIESNHGSLVFRKGKVHGIPRHVLKSYKQVLEAPNGWSWHFDLQLTLSDGKKVYFHHARSSSVLRASQQMGMNCVFGHHHNKFGVEHWSNGQERHWGMFVGCLINIRSMAFEYGNCNLKQPIIGCGLIIDGEPKLAPMIVDRKNRWIRSLK